MQGNISLSNLKFSTFLETVYGLPFVTENQDDRRVNTLKNILMWPKLPVHTIKRTTEGMPYVITDATSKQMFNVKDEGKTKYQKKRRKVSERAELVKFDQSSMSLKSKKQGPTTSKKTVNKPKETLEQTKDKNKTKLCFICC